MPTEENRGPKCPGGTVVQYGQFCHSNPACYLGSWENGTHWCCPGKLETPTAGRQKKIKHNESQGLGVGCAMFKIKTKDNGWEQIIVTNAKKRIKDPNLISRLWGNFVGGERVFLDSAKAERWGQVSRRSQKAHTSGVRFECHRHNQEEQRHLGDPGTWCWVGT